MKHVKSLKLTSRVSQKYLVDQTITALPQERHKPIQSPQNPNTVISLSRMRGQEISVVMTKTWQGISASECRLTMMEDLRKFGVGFGDLENFDLDLNSKFRSNFYQERVIKFGSQSKVIEEAMKIKFRDEEKYLF